MMPERVIFGVPSWELRVQSVRSMSVLVGF